MGKWIDADALKEWLDEYLSVFKKYDKGTIKGFVDHAPSIDIVRCKECRHRYNDGWIEPRWTCDYLKDMRLKDDDFCSYGEREGE